jgi:hypothetical protein
VKTVCTCSICRRAVRRAIVVAFRQRRCWMDEHMIGLVGKLSWLPRPFFRSVIADMLRQGLLIASCGPDDVVPRYILSALTLPVRTGGGER